MCWLLRRCVDGFAVTDNLKPYDAPQEEQSLMHYLVWPAQLMSLVHTPHMRQPPAALLSCQAAPGHPKYQIWPLQQSWPQRCCCHQEDRKPPAAAWMTCIVRVDNSQHVPSAYNTWNYSAHRESVAFKIKLLRFLFAGSCGDRSTCSEIAENDVICLDVNLQLANMCWKDSALYRSERQPHDSRLDIVSMRCILLWEIAIPSVGGRRTDL